MELIFGGKHESSISTLFCLQAEGGNGSGNSLNDNDTDDTDEDEEEDEDESTDSDSDTSKGKKEHREDDWGAEDDEELEGTHSFNLTHPSISIY